MNSNKVVDRATWEAHRKELLQSEKELIQLRDKVSEQRRALPWVEMTEKYKFTDLAGVRTLSDLFADKSQLIINHFMFGKNWEEGCPSCSFWADGFEGAAVHLAARDATFVVVSSAQIEKLEQYRLRMGWTFNWVSCFGSSFNHDFQVSFTEEQKAEGMARYNYRDMKHFSEELPGISVFVKDEQNRIFHTYSCYSRGLDNLNPSYQLLDLLPKGRDEASLEFPMAWVRRKDQY